MHNRRGSLLPRLLRVLDVALFALGGTVQAAQRPNVLFSMTDQQRWDTLSIAGNDVLDTPNRDAVKAAL